MPFPLAALLVFLIAFLLSGGSTPLAARLGYRLGMLDRPGGRRRHRGEIPRTGGLALWLAFVVTVLFAQILPIPRFDPKEVVRLTGLLLGGTLSLILGLIDDRWELPPGPQFLGQALIALLSLPFLIFIEYVNNPLTGRPLYFPLPIVVLLTVFWLMGMMNTVNWLDGIDGLASGVVAIVALILFLHAGYRLDPPQHSVALLPAALAGACLGFLPWNWSPARLFLGSSGALFLGYTLGVLAIIGGAKVATVVMAMALPIADVAWLIAYRWRRGRRPTQGGRDHLHFRLLDAGWSPHRIRMAYYGFAAAAGGIALLIPSALYKALALALLAGVLMWVLRQAPPEASG
ncbi:putative undecaprenyl-phosphate N-acetylglucosaminyl 1-phosphate transferase [Candidatus Thermoflexus japonica]|uniref:Putative undecaprenyl-phosphate N-acetylglucosaminyl 1-phosphate transferase n=1 Tax=Candidatus Thermoflexus japonica TaxID=2035417 RepID=A0A2H5Y3Y6_9CHLR|nr:putative undecaprenyl-phosphate N-acetylglucosaminyl 1-phosphate transferase [Candidatus Thermoflexus japonica]